MVYLLLAEGFEEIEALFPLDILRRGGVEVCTVGIGSREIRGSHGIPIIADITAEEATDTPEMLILPGGMPGSVNLDESSAVDALIARTAEAKGHLAAICAAPFVLGKRGLLSGRDAVCYPGFEDKLIGANYLACKRVVTDGNITTAVGMGAAGEFAIELLSILKGKETARKVADSAFVETK